MRLLLALVGLATLSTVNAQTPLGEMLSQRSSSSRLLPSFPAGFYAENAASGASFFTPVSIAFAPDGRMFVAEKAGRVMVVVNDQLQSTPVIDLSAEVLNQGDRGLIGLALDPNFATNRYLYLLYSVDHDGTGDYPRTDAFGRLSRYTVSTTAPYVAEASSRTVLIGASFSEGIPNCSSSHSVGSLVFGTDGTLLVSTGDAADFNQVDVGGLYANCFGAGRLDPSEDVGAFRSLQLGSLAGKILRIDPATGQGLSSNPFFTGDPTDTESKVWAYGLRNPFRLGVRANGSINPADGQPGTVYFGDVGWQDWEELGPAFGGENFAWPCYEGPFPEPGYQNSNSPANTCSTLPPRTDSPYYWSHHNTSQSNPPGLKGNAIVGGDFYLGDKYPAAYQNAFFYADFPNGWMALVRVDANDTFLEQEVFSTDSGPVVDLEYDPVSGYIHYVDIVGDQVFRIRHTDGDANNPPVAQASATPTQGSAPLVVQFSSTGTFDPDGDPILYAWSFGDGNTSTAENPSHTYTTSGEHAATLTITDTFGASTSTSEIITVSAGGPPQAFITSPVNGLGVASGQVLTLSASATDPDQPPNTLFYQWAVSQVHGEHTHPDIFSSANSTAIFMVPDHGVEDEVVYYRIKLTVMDSEGLTDIVEHQVWIDRPDDVDVTSLSTPISFVTAPQGGGNYDIEVIRDGEFPPVGHANSSDQYDTYTSDAGGRAEDWIGYSFSEPFTFTHLTFQEGAHFDDGGWFNDLRVEIRQNGAWVDAAHSAPIPDYRGHDGVNFEIYEMRFHATTGDGIRLIGTPGGSATFISVGELRVFATNEVVGALPAPWENTDMGPVLVTGSATYEDGAFTIAGGGDLWGDTDACQLVYQPWTGDLDFQVRLDALAGTDPWAKAGLMVRASLDPQAPQAMLIATPQNGVHLQYRSTAATDMQWITGPNLVAPTWLRMERRGDIFTALVSPDGQNWTPVGNATIELGPSVFVGMPVTSTDYAGRADLATAVFSNVDLQAPVGTLPAPWQSTDIGSVLIAGQASFDSGVYTVSGGGDLWGDTDASHFLYQPWSGDLDLEVKLDAFSGVDGWAKAGLMIRGSLDPQAPQAMLIATPQNGVHLQYRTTAATDMQWITGPNLVAPVWLRLERRGDVLTARVSQDGITWTNVGTVAVVMGANVLAGMPVTSTDYTGRADLATASFSNVSISGAGGLVAGAESFRINSVYPNPFNPATVIELQLPDPGEYVVEVFDMLGRRVYLRELREQNGGVQTERIDLARYASGSYVLRARRLEDGDVLTRRITLLR